MEGLVGLGGRWVGRLPIVGGIPYNEPYFLGRVMWEAFMQGASVQIQTVIYGMDRQSLRRSLDSIANAVRIDREGPQTLGELVVVHGDASPVRTFDEADVKRLQDEYRPWFTYVYTYFNENTGTSRGHNRMFEECTSTYVVVQNPDIQYSPRFFERMLGPFERTDFLVGLVEARQTPIEHPKTYDPVTKLTDWSTGACIMICSEVFRKVGGFDAESFFLYCDDVDLSWRIRLAGYSLVYQPLVPVYHPKHLSPEGHWQPTEAEVYYSALARLYMLHKWSYEQKCRELSNAYMQGDDPVARRAAQEFEECRAMGRLPVPLDASHRIADINDEGYAHVRFAV